MRDYLNPFEPANALSFALQSGWCRTIVCCAVACFSSTPCFAGAQVVFRPPTATTAANQTPPVDAAVLQITNPRLAKQSTQLEPIGGNAGNPIGFTTNRPEYEFAPPTEFSLNGPASQQPTSSQFTRGFSESHLNAVPNTRILPSGGFQQGPPRFTTQGTPIQVQSNYRGPNARRNGTPRNSNGVDYFIPQQGPDQLDAILNGPVQNPSASGQALAAGLNAVPSMINVDESSRDTDGLDLVIQRYDSGKPRILRHVVEDENGNYPNHGPWQVKSPTGRLVADGTYKYGIMDGVWQREHAAGSPGIFETRPFNLFQGPYLSVANFRDGKLEGLWTIYDRNRQKIFEIPYAQGVRHGEATWFYPNNAKMRQATFKNGLIHGEILDFNDADDVTKREQFVDGRRIVRNTTFYRPSVKKTEDYYLAPKLKPVALDDWWAAKPTTYQPSGKEIQNGTSMAWYDNGQPQKKGQFAAGKPVGQFTWWHANGNKNIEGFYANGEKQKSWTWWYANGYKQFEGAFEGNQPVGVWSAWYDNGQLRTKKDYSSKNSSSQPTNEQDSNSKTEQAPNQPNGDTPTNASSVVAPENDSTTPEALPAPREGTTQDNPPEQEMEAIAPNGFRKPQLPGQIENATPPNTEGGQIDLTTAPDPDPVIPVVTEPTANEPAKIPENVMEEIGGESGK